MEIALIGDIHTVHGFRLAGIKKAFLIDEIKGQNTRETIKGLFDDGIGILLVTERAYKELRSELEEAKRFKKGLMPIILEIPDSDGPLADKIDPMRKLIKRTVGFEIA
jgi:vacuolar-type H+-ATPase subunit F/Vma7